MKAARRTSPASALAAAVALATLLTGPPAGAQEDAAKVFRQAREYTVRVETQITEPFGNDERGSYEGAGFLVDAERGWIVTNAHVVGQSPSEVQVAFADQPFRPARKVYVDPFTDMAVLALGAPVHGRAAAPLSAGDPPGVGEPVAVFGHPLGLPFTGSRGIVSGQTDQFGASLLQIDATVDHGNSGGPVIDLRTGEVVGIATAGAGGDKADRLNFATPLPDVQRILAMLRRGLTPCPPILAFGLLMDEDDRHTMQVGYTHDAERWPFQPGDRILRMAGSGAPLASLTDLVSALRASAGPVSLVVERDGRETTLTVRPQLFAPVTERRGVVLDGALIAPVELEDLEVFPDVPKLAVQAIEPGSTAEALAMDPGDLLWSVDGRRVGELDSLTALVQRRPAGAKLTLVLMRVSDREHRFFDWHIRELPGDDFRAVGPEPGPAAREPRQ
jgi:serine protease Do